MKYVETKKVAKVTTFAAATGAFVAADTPTIVYGVSAVLTLVEILKLGLSLLPKSDKWLSSLIPLVTMVVSFVLAFLLLEGSVKQICVQALGVGLSAMGAYSGLKALFVEGKQKLSGI